MNRISRRNFLKAAGVGAAALGLAAEEAAVEDATLDAVELEEPPQAARPKMCIRDSNSSSSVARCSSKSQSNEFRTASLSTSAL